MVDVPVAIPDIADPSQTRAVLYASNTYLSVPVDAVSGAALTYGGLGRNVSRDGAKPSASAATNAAAFNAAATAEIASGSKTLIVNGAYNITGVNLDKIHSVTLIGTGSITGVYRKEVFPPRTPGPADSYEADVIPQIHLQKLNAAYERTGIINVVLWGDSISTYRPGTGNTRMDLKVEAYRAMLLKQFPNATINFYNRAIGGAFYSDWDKVNAGANPPYTWYIPGTAWNTHIGALNPDLVILAFGMNPQNSVQDLIDIRAYLGTLTCDVLWETCMVPNLAYSGYTQTLIEQRDREAGLTRSYARLLGDGIIDFHRRCCVVRDGFDIRMAHSLQGTKETITASGNVCQGTKKAWNWKITAHFNASTWANGATTRMQCIVGNLNDYIEVRKTAGGNWSFQWVAGGVTVLFGPVIDSGVAASTSATAQITFEVRDDVVTCYLLDGQSSNVSEEPIFTSRIVRQTNYVSPFVQLAVVAGGSMTSADFVYAEQRKNMPLITNKELWDSTYYTSDGGINHPTSAGCEMIYLPVLEQITLRATMDLNTTAKGVPVNADRVFYGDSTTLFSPVYATWTQVKAFLKTYFDTLYPTNTTGTFTPVIVGTTVAGVGTYSNQAGSWTRLGDRLFFEVDITWSAHTGTGNLTVTALPVAAAASAAFSVYWDALTYTSTPMAIIGTAGTTIILRQAASGGGFTAIAMDTSARLIISGCYRV